MQLLAYQVIEISTTNFTEMEAYVAHDALLMIRSFDCPCCSPQGSLSMAYLVFDSADVHDHLLVRFSRQQRVNAGRK